ncbi:MAG TPA: LuxR C-terminal-related transcriptional regulator [Candidatus Rubrimentiphilum sp.]|nr:LuxR C-terminal-related transcriptional regulator [Candidatus Rubrimentiphilum sp.]
MIRPVSSDGRVDTGGVFEPIVRQRIVERVAAAAFQPIVLIVAPAGYGKSVAVRQYLGSIDGAKVRYDVRSEHSNLLGFLRGFAEAFSEVAPGARKTLSGAYEKNRSSVSPASDLAMWMYAHIKTYTGIIAIDDFHITENDPEIARFLVSLIERTKGRARWILASRSTTNLPVGSWLAYGHMDLTVDEQDLRFTPEEARQAAKSTRVSVRDEELNEILSMTHGWPTALSFALRSSTRSVDLRNITATTREMIYQYLAEQVYNTLGAEERDLLHLSSYLGEINADILRRAGYDTARGAIESLRQRVAFIYPDSPGTYKCHDLFKDFLQHQLELQGDRAVEYTRLRAAKALEAAGRPAAALSLYGQALAMPDVLRILGSHGFQLADEGHADVVDTALESLPAGVRATNPLVLGLRALAEEDHGRLDRAESLLQRALSKKCGKKLCVELSLRLALILINQMRDVSEMLQPLGGDPDLPVNLQGEIASLLAIAHAYAGRSSEALAAIAKAKEALTHLESNADRAKILQRIGVAGLRLGLPLEETRGAQIRAASLASEEGMFALAGRAFVALASIALSYEDDPVKEVWYSQQAANAAMKAGDLVNLQTALLHLLTVEGRRGNVERIKALEQQIAPISTSDSRRMSYVIPIRAYVAAWEGRFDDAHRLMSTIAGSDRFFAHDRAVNAASDTLFLMALGQRDSAISMMRTVFAEIEKTDSNLLYARRQVEIAKLLVALAESLAGRKTYAQRALAKVPEHDDVVTKSLREAVFAAFKATQEPALEVEIDESIDRLHSIGCGGIGLLVKSVYMACKPSHSNVNCLGLTPAETDVLQALAKGQRPKDIAQDSGRSTYTVQAHIQNIIRKLGCSGRAEALKIARARGLIA